MTNVRNQKHKKRKMEAEMDFLDTKIAFVAGVVVLITIIKDFIELCIQSPEWVALLYLTICLIVYILVLCTKIFDKKMKSKGVENFGKFLTMVSIIVFIIENSVIKFAYAMSRTEVIIIVFALGGVVVFAACKLLITKYRE